MLDFVVALAATVTIILGHVFLPNMPAASTCALHRAVFPKTLLRPQIISPVLQIRPMAVLIICHGTIREFPDPPIMLHGNRLLSQLAVFTGCRYPCPWFPVHLIAWTRLFSQIGPARLPALPSIGRRSYGRTAARTSARNRRSSSAQY